MKAQKILIVEDDVFSSGMMAKILQDHRCETPILPLHRGIFLVLIFLLLALFVVQISQAQEALPKLNKPSLKMNRGQGGREPSGSFSLTEQQKKALETLHRAYMAEAIPLKRELLVLKIELRHLLSDPNVQPQLLFDQQRKISMLQARLEELSLSYQVKARSVFTKEQWERLAEDSTLGMERMFETETGMDRGLQRGVRHK